MEFASNFFFVYHFLYFNSLFRSFSRSVFHSFFFGFLLFLSQLLYISFLCEATKAAQLSALGCSKSKPENQPRFFLDLLDSSPTGTAACSFSAQVINQKSKGPASSRHCRTLQQAALFCWGSFPSPFTACLQFSQPSLLFSALLLTYLHISTGMPIF